MPTNLPATHLLLFPTDRNITKTMARIHLRGREWRTIRHGNHVSPTLPEVVIDEVSSVSISNKIINLDITIKDQDEMEKGIYNSGILNLSDINRKTFSNLSTIVKQNHEPTRSFRRRSWSYSQSGWYYLAIPVRPEWILRWEYVQPLKNLYLWTWAKHHRYECHAAEIWLES